MDYPDAYAGQNLKSVPVLVQFEEAGASIMVQQYDIRVTSESSLTYTPLLLEKVLEELQVYPVDDRHYRRGSIDVYEVARLSERLSAIFAEAGVTTTQIKDTPFRGFQFTFNIFIREGAAIRPTDKVKEINKEG